MFKGLKTQDFLPCVAVYCENNALYAVIPLGLNAVALVLSLAVRILTSRLLKCLNGFPENVRKCGGRSDVTGRGLHTGQ